MQVVDRKPQFLSLWSFSQNCLECPNDMELASFRATQEWARQKPRGLCHLASKATHHPFCSILPVTQVSPVHCKTRLHRDTNTGRWGSRGNHLQVWPPEDIYQDGGWCLNKSDMSSTWHGAKYIVIRKYQLCLVAQVSLSFFFFFNMYLVIEDSLSAFCRHLPLSAEFTVFLIHSFNKSAFLKSCRMCQPYAPKINILDTNHKVK